MLRRVLRRVWQGAGPGLAGPGPGAGIGPATALRGALLALLFVIEVVGLVAVAWWAVSLGGVVGVLVAVAAVCAMAGLWGLFAAPKASHRLRGPVLAVFMLAWFAVGGLCLAAVGHPWWGVGLVVGFAVTKGLLALAGGSVSAPPAVQVQGPDIGQ